MTISLKHITFDCEHPERLAGFWAAALDREVDPDPNEFFASIGLNGPDAPAWLFLKVPEGKTAKNRVHLDTESDDRRADIARLVGLGATEIEDRSEFGHQWTVMLDPEGNEFCIADR